MQLQLLFSLYFVLSLSELTGHLRIRGSFWQFREIAELAVIDAPMQLLIQHAEIVISSPEKPCLRTAGHSHCHSLGFCVADRPQRLVLTQGHL